MSSNCQKMKYARAKRAKNIVFHCQICKFVGFLLPSSSWLLKLPMCCRVGSQVQHEKLDLKRVYKLKVKFLSQKHNEADVWSSKPQLRSLFPMVILRFVIKTIGMRKRRFDRSTVIIKQSEDKNFHKY